jgi:hypothetical protein
MKPTGGKRQSAQNVLGSPSAFYSPQTQSERSAPRSNSTGQYSKQSSLTKTGQTYFLAPTTAKQ